MKNYLNFETEIKDLENEIQVNPVIEEVYIVQAYRTAVGKAKKGQITFVRPDDLGAQYIYQDGYSPQGMYDVLSVLKDQETYSKKIAEQRGQEPRSYHGVFASHPSNDLRLQEVLDNVSNTYQKGNEKTKDMKRSGKGMARKGKGNTWYE